MLDLNPSQNLAARPRAGCFLACRGVASVRSRSLLILAGLLTTNAPAQTFTTLHNFTNSPDGDLPYGSVVLSGNTLYGTARFGGSSGGSSGNGTVFAVNTDGTGFTNLHSFTMGSGSYPNINNSDGANPIAGLILSGNHLYGTAYDGDSNGFGTVFAVNTDGTGFTNLHSFTALVSSTNSDGANPQAGLALSGGTLYGTTVYGGSSGRGTVFGVNTDGSGFTNLHSFTATSGSYGTNSDGANPKAELLLTNNNLYGMTESGGSSGNGIVFAINTDGTGFTNLHSFTALSAPYYENGTNSDGALPMAGLTLSSNTLYGAAEYGGSSGLGTLFAVNTDGTGFTNIHSFAYGDGANPLGGLVLSGNTLYGTANEGGSTDNGTVFVVNTDGRLFTKLHSFTGLSGSYPYINNDGANPAAGLVLSGNTLYGTAQGGGSDGGGTVFSFFGLPVQFTANPASGLVPLTVQFTSPSVDVGGNAITNWNWNFGDGSTSTAQNPSHIYATTGDFSPNLVATNNLGTAVHGIGPSITALLISGLVRNGGFETGDFAGWTLIRDPNYTFVDNGSASGITPHSGSYEAAGGGIGSLAYLSQTLPTTAGASYLLSLWLNSPDGMSPNEFLASWNGNTLFDETNVPALGWTNLQFLVSATSAYTVLELGFRDDNSYLGLDDISVVPAQPSIAGLNLAGTNLVVNGNNGLSGRTYFVLMSPNLALPLSQWTPVATNTLNAEGNFTITATNAVNPNAPQRFYILKVQ